MGHDLEERVNMNQPTNGIGTCDYGFMAWLVVVKNIKPIDGTARKIRRGKMEYFFPIDQDEWTKLRIEYSSSVFQRIMNEIKSLKDPSF